MELAIVVTIASLLIGIALPRMQQTFHQRDVNGARDGVMLLAARARAQAMEQAQTVEFRLDADGGVAAVLQAGDTIEVLRFAENNVVAESEAGDIVMCYTARGFATEPCSTNLESPAEVRFMREGVDGITASLEVWQLGQLRKL